MTEQERAKIELAEYRDAAYERLHALCGTRADAPNWADIACLLRERQELKRLAQGRPGPDVIEGIAKTIWLAEFSRAFSRAPSDPWENQAEPIKEGHRNTARKLVEAGYAVTSTDSGGR